MSNEHALMKKNPGEWLAQQEQKIAPMLGRSKELRQRFMASVLSALRTNDTLLRAAQANPRSLLNAVLQAAQAGLDIGGVRKHGALVPYKNEVTFIPMYQGLVHLMTSGDDPAAEDIDAEVIHEHDEWKMWKDQDGVHFRFSPAKGDPGKVVGAYACAYLSKGRCKIKYMPIEEIHRHRDRSASYKTNPKASPWHTDYEAMVRKTPVRAIANMLKLSNRLEVAIETDNIDEGVIEMPSEPMVVSETRLEPQVEAVPVPRREVKTDKKPPRKLDRPPKEEKTPEPVEEVRISAPPEEPEKEEDDPVDKKRAEDRFYDLYQQLSAENKKLFHAEIDKELPEGWDPSNPKAELSEIEWAIETMEGLIQ